MLVTYLLLVEMLMKKKNKLGSIFKKIIFNIVTKKTENVNININTIKNYIIEK